MPIMPLSVLMPVARAVPDAAESVTSESAECVRTSPPTGILSKWSFPLGPTALRRARATWLAPMPSPMQTMTFRTRRARVSG